MISTNAEKINVSWVSLSARVLSSSKFGLDYDRVRVFHEIGLQQPLVEDERFYIPPSDKALDTRENFPDGTITNFAGQRFKDIQDELDKYTQAVKEGNSQLMDELHKVLKSTTILAPVVFKQGTSVLTFEYELALYPNHEQVFDLSLWAPMPTFNVVPGGKVVTMIELPGSHFNTQVLEAEGYLPDGEGNPTSQTVSKVLNNDFGLRQIVSWVWQNDPLFKVRYKY
jgi:hypothetical protein